MVYGSHPKAKGSTSRSFSDLALCVNDAVRTLKKSGVEFDAIVVTGVSGLVVGAPLALQLQRHLVVLRKANESCHDDRAMLIGAGLLNEASRVIFVDDFISSGATRRRCEESIKAHGATLVATLEYEKCMDEDNPCRLVKIVEPVL